ncbi:MAG: YlmH/Sll1252 family protein [Eubacteriales bacterium]|nr:YlmH/Sll1252 family protein [Eubacteriales bacterium]
MPRSSDPPVAFSRLLELAQQADRLGDCRFTPFLTPPEAELAQSAAKRADVEITLFGGVEDAERRMARFSPADVKPQPFPIAALEIAWPKQQAPGHRDLLGAVMALGLRRDHLGDIALITGRAYLFADAALAESIAQSLTEAGRVKLAVHVAAELPVLPRPEGETLRGTVQTPRLDAIVAEGFHLSRGAAAELIAEGAVKLRFAPTLRPDARVEPGDTISVRGLGRLTVEDFGETTRKGRIPVRITRFGASHG